MQITNFKLPTPEELIFVAGDASQSDSEERIDDYESHEQEENRRLSGTGGVEEKEKTDQSQQTTPTTPPADTGNFNLINVLIR